jgi:hypothetical protein
MVVGWTVAATAGANRPTPHSYPFQPAPKAVPPKAFRGSGPAPLFVLLLTFHSSPIPLPALGKLFSDLSADG